MCASSRGSGRGERDGPDPDAVRNPTVLDESLHTEALPVAVPCPFCEGLETEQFSSFGSQLSTSQYYCRSCRTVFEFMKWRRQE
ncbi:MAG: hypothetical protein ACE5HQ_02525 [Gemmatimonadota bacterium]